MALMQRVTTKVTEGLPAWDELQAAGQAEPRVPYGPPSSPIYPDFFLTDVIICSQFFYGVFFVRTGLDFLNECQTGTFLKPFFVPLCPGRRCSSPTPSTCPSVRWPSRTTQDFLEREGWVSDPPTHRRTWGTVVSSVVFHLEVSPTNRTLAPWLIKKLENETSLFIFLWAFVLAWRG